MIPSNPYLLSASNLLNFQKNRIPTIIATILYHANVIMLSMFMINKTTFYYSFGYKSIFSVFLFVFNNFFYEMTATTTRIRTNDATTLTPSILFILHICLEIS